MITHRERIQACLNGEATDRTPIALWRHFPVDDQTPESLARATLHHQETYDFDLVKVTPASSFAVKDWGVKDEWVGDAEGSRRYTQRSIHNPGDWEKLQVLPPDSPHLAAQLQALRLIRAGLGIETPILQTIFNPLSQAKNLAGNERLLEHLRTAPDAVLQGLKVITETTRQFIEAARETGIDGLFYAIQHAQADILTPEEYETFGLPFDKQLMESARGLWCNMAHLHGRNVFFPMLSRLPFQVINWHDRETRPSLAEALQIFPGAVCGGLRQDSLVLSDPQGIRTEAEDAIQQTHGRRLILGTGCVVPITAAHGNYLAALQAAHWSQP